MQLLKRLNHPLLGASLALFLPVFAVGAPAQAESDDARVAKVVSAYTEALGGQAAIDAIKTREVDAARGRQAKYTFFWQSPDSVVRLGRKGRQGYDGNTRWIENKKKKKVMKLSKDARDEMETIANPTRFVHLHDLYPELHSAPDTSVDGQPMNVLVAPNQNGATKLYFSTSDHLLYRIEESGVLSVYFKHVIDFADYRSVDRIKLPFQIDLSSDEPGAESANWRIKLVKQNVPINPAMFRKSRVEVVSSGRNDQ